MVCTSIATLEAICAVADKTRQEEGEKIISTFVMLRIDPGKRKILVDSMILMEFQCLTLIKS